LRIRPLAGYLAMIGKTISHYRILEKLGSGGMGVVYKAEDTKLGRMVALKVLPPERVADPNRKRRFVQEARAASALNHPNIITIYDIDEAEGVHYIAMEHVEGKTLDRLIARHGLRVNEALKYAVQMAAALAKAHSAGIVHRDLKPTNVMVTDDGLVKVLDFGLAKLTEAAPAGDAETAVTLEPTTEEGTIVGTVGYMSPEQAEGKPVDARSDIFSFGSVLYEMLTGQRAFQGETKASTIAAILREEPKPLSQVVEGLPREVDRLVKRCLRKDPAHRVQHMDDLKVALEELKEESDSGELADTAAVAPVYDRRTRRAALAAIAAVVIVVALAVAGWYWFARSRLTTPEVALTAVPLTAYPGHEDFPSFSPDGTQVAFSWNGEKEDNYDIYVKAVGGEPPLRLTSNPAREFSPAWSPDGRWIAFCRDLPGRKYAVVLTSPIPGPERILTELNSPGIDVAPPFLAWSADSRWLVMAGKESVAERPVALFLFSLAKGETRKFTSPPANIMGDSGPAFSPDGHTLVFSRRTTLGSSGLYLLALSRELKPLADPRCLTVGNWDELSPTWTADGSRLVFSAFSGSDTGLWRVDSSGTSSPQRLAGLGKNVRSPTISRRGNRLAYAQTILDANIYRMVIPPQGRGGHPLRKLISSTRMDWCPQISPDGKKIAFMSDRSGSWEIWICDSDGSNLLQLTSYGKADVSPPQWSPDGSRLTFAANPEGRYEIFIVGADGGNPKRLDPGAGGANSPSWSRDGRWIFYDDLANTGIYKVSLEGGPAVRVTDDKYWGAIEAPDGDSVYAMKNTPARELWRVSEKGGEAQKVLESLPDHLNYALVEGGIFFIPRPDPKSGYSLHYLNTATGRIERVASFEKPVCHLAVSPDRRWILYAQFDQLGSDLMLVENFR
jgi:Tol biopolymer transport system component